jgi:heterodisulfide reductase subunit A-like polyferredoxin
MFSGLAIKLGILAAVVAMIGGGVWYILHQNSKLAVAQEQMDKLTTAIRDQKDVIDGLKLDAELNRRANVSVGRTVTLQNTDTNRLRRKFTQSKTGEPRSLGALAVAKPDTVERLINAGSANAARCIELATGAEFTKEELAATNPSEINTICPSLANPNYKGDQ